jgi:hypothetical protein
MDGMLPLDWALRNPHRDGAREAVVLLTALRESVASLQTARTARAEPTFEKSPKKKLCRVPE